MHRIELVKKMERTLEGRTLKEVADELELMHILTAMRHDWRQFLDVPENSVPEFAISYLAPLNDLMEDVKTPAIVQRVRVELVALAATDRLLRAVNMGSMCEPYYFPHNFIGVKLAYAHHKYAKLPREIAHDVYWRAVHQIRRLQHVEALHGRLMERLALPATNARDEFCRTNLLAPLAEILGADNEGQATVLFSAKDLGAWYRRSIAEELTRIADALDHIRRDPRISTRTTRFALHIIEGDEDCEEARRLMESTWSGAAINVLDFPDKAAARQDGWYVPKLDTPTYGPVSGIGHIRSALQPGYGRDKLLDVLTGGDPFRSEDRLVEPS